MPFAAWDTPRKMFPPPTTMAICTPVAVRLGDLLGHPADGDRVDAVAELRVGERLSRQLQQHAVRPVVIRTPIVPVVAEAAQTDAPTSTRVKRRTEMFSPIFIPSWLTRSAIVPSNFSLLTNGCS
jgi:hypothetical protein